MRLLCGGEGNRTVLYESASGVPGSIAADWAFAVARNESVRMCAWDRPGYGLSDNAPSASLEHTVQALELALKQAGELARAKNGDGFVLASEGFGSLVSRVFAARHAKVVSAMLFIDPQTAPTYFDRLPPGLARHFNYFFRDVLSDVLSPLGIRRWTYIITSSSKRTAAARRLSPAREGLEPGILRATLQEAVCHSSQSLELTVQHLAHEPTSTSAIELHESLEHFPSRAPSIVLSSRSRGSVWSDAQRAFAHDVLGRGLVRWEEVKSSERSICADGQHSGRKTCQRALRHLLRR